MAKPQKQNPILDDPANFLHSIDVDGDSAIFFRTNAQTLRDAPFLDGRSPISTAPFKTTPLSEVIIDERRGPIVNRFLFNCSFCGSTLLSRLLDVPGRSLVLKEPRCLTDIAAWKSFNLRDRLPLDLLAPSLRLALAALRRPFTPRELVTVKMASQGNVLIDTLAEGAPNLRPVFITISRISFLRAIFRGGADRMHYAAIIAWNMAMGEPDGDLMLKDAMGAGADPLRKAANLAILARFLQVGSFQRAARAGGWTDDQVIDFDMITRNPHEAAVKAATALALDIDDEAIGRNVAFHAGRYAKQSNIAFSVERQRANDRTALAEHRQVFDDALAWAETTLGPQRNVTG